VSSTTVANENPSIKKCVKYFFWTPLFFFFKFALRSQQSDFFLLLRQFVTSVIDTGSKFATGINNISGTSGKFTAVAFDTSSKFTTGVGDNCGPPWLASISANFQKKLEMTLMLYSGA
jgi:hypothetical protein